MREVLLFLLFLCSLLGCDGASVTAASASAVTDSFKESLMPNEDTDSSARALDMDVDMESNGDDDYYDDDDDDNKSGDTTASSTESNHTTSTHHHSESKPTWLPFVPPSKAPTIASSSSTPGQSTSDTNTAPNSDEPKTRNGRIVEEDDDDNDNDDDSRQPTSDTNTAPNSDEPKTRNGRIVEEDGGDVDDDDRYTNGNNEKGGDSGSDAGNQNEGQSGSDHPEPTTPISGVINLRSEDSSSDGYTWSSTYVLYTVLAFFLLGVVCWCSFRRILVAFWRLLCGSGSSSAPSTSQYSRVSTDADDVELTAH